MTHQAHYSPMARQLFGQFLDQELDLETLIERLREIELQLLANEDDDEAETEAKLWFRFFAGDDMKLSISEIAQDLRDPYHPNARILLRGIAFGLETEELEVHYS